MFTLCRVFAITSDFVDCLVFVDRDNINGKDRGLKSRKFRSIVIYLRGIIWGTKGGTQGNNAIMGWAIVINKVVNPYHVRDHT